MIKYSTSTTIAKLLGAHYLITRIDKSLHGTKQGAIGAYSNDHFIQWVYLAIHDRRKRIGQGFHKARVSLLMKQRYRPTDVSR